jgi:hypothetical protein
MAESTKPSGGYGDVDWIDLTSNWYASDAEWLQSRSIVRIAGTAPLTTEVPTANNAVGRVFFSDSVQSLVINLTGGYHRVASSGNVGITDSGSSAELKLISGLTGTGITFSSSGVSLGTTAVTSTLTVTGATTLNGYLTAKAGEATGAVVTTSSSGVTINTTGSNAVVLTTAADGLNVNSSIRITSGGALSVAGNTSLAGTLNVTGTSTIAGLSASSSAVSGNSTVGGTLTVTTGLVTAGGGISTTAITASGLVTSAGLTTSGIITSSSSTDLRLAIPSGRALRISAPTIGDANIYYGSLNTIRNAWVVYGADPGVANVPEGTIWIT